MILRVEKTWLVCEMSAFYINNCLWCLIFFISLSVLYYRQSTLQLETSDKIPSNPILVFLTFMYKALLFLVICRPKMNLGLHTMKTTWFVL